MSNNHIIQIKADNGNFVNYTGNLGIVRPMYDSIKAAGKGLAQLQKMTAGNGFEFRIYSKE